MHTIDPDFIFGIGRISEFGARKYHMRNFLMAPGMEWSKVYDSLMRHLMLWWGGEELDLGPNGEFGPSDNPETDMKWSGMPHLLHVAWNVMVLYTYSKHGVYADGDDRPSKTEQAGVRWQDWKDDFDQIRGLVDPATNVQKPEEPFETQLQSLVAELESLGFKANPEGFFLNEHGETPSKILDDYVAGAAPRQPPAPAFMKDPLRAGLAAQNSGDKTNA